MALGRRIDNLGHALLLGNTAELLLAREATGELVTVAQPAARTTAAACALGGGAVRSPLDALAAAA